MAFAHQPGQFSLFKNDKKEAGDKRPDYKGDGADMDGNPIEVAAWIKQGAKGKFMSCRFKPKEAQQAKPPEKKPEVKNSFDDMTDDIPF